MCQSSHTSDLQTTTAASYTCVSMTCANIPARSKTESSARSCGQTPIHYQPTTFWKQIWDWCGTWPRESMRVIEDFRCEIADLISFATPANTSRSLRLKVSDFCQPKAKL